MRAKWLPRLGVLTLLAAFSARAADFDPALVDAAGKEGIAVWYTGLIVNQISRPMAEAFEQRFPGIKVHYSRASNTDTTVKLLNEARARRVQADVVDVTSGIHSLTDAKLLAAYKPRAAAHYPDVLKDKDGFWTASNLYFLTIAYNTNLVTAKDAPKTFADLLDPRWKGHMAWTSELAIQGAPGFIYNALSTMGQEKGLAYLKQFAAQQPVSIATSPRAVLDQVISGEYQLGIMMYNHHVAISAGEGAPVKAVNLEPLVALFSIMGILRDAPHPNAGRLLVEYILSDEGQKVMASHDYLPADPNVPARIPELKPETGHFPVNFISPELARDGLAKWTALYHEVFR
jgi:ABC-type Fe3+ transport system substrate-binding protein